MVTPSPLDHSRQEQAQALAARHRHSLLVPSQTTPPLQPHPAYAGLVTRTIAFALDGAVVNGVATLVGIALALGVSVLHISGYAKTIIEAIGGATWVIWSIGYFTFFWSSTGETPGNRVMRIRVISSREHGQLGPLLAAARFGFLILAVIPLGAGIVMMLWDERARCLHDRLARTVVRCG